jgi:hypothetical protein
LLVFKLNYAQKTDSAEHKKPEWTLLHGYAKPDTTHHTKLLWSIKPSFDIDQRFSFIYNTPVNIWGARIGLLFNESFKAGFGAYFLSNRLKSKTLDPTTGTPFYFAQRDVYFGTFYLEPFLMRREYWELSVPVEIGFGQSYFKVYNGNNLFLGQEIKYFFPTGAGLSLSLKMPAFFGCRPFRWIGINGLVGYRYRLLASAFKTDYDGSFWSISATIFFDRVFDDVRYWKKKKKERALLN